MLKDFDKISTYEIQVASNFHTHNYLCGHATGTVSDYVKVAVEHNYKALGVSDHFVSHNDRNSPYIDFNTIDTEYLPQFENAKKLYGNKIAIYKGAEVAYYDGDYRFYRKLRDKLDYLILGQHGYMLNGKRKNSFWDGNDEQNVVAYCNHSVMSLKTGLFDIFAHPDLIFYNNPIVTKRMEDAVDFMVKTAVEQDVVLELNANGIRNANFSYPTDLLADCCLRHNAKVIVSSDCHSPNELYDSYVLKLYAYAKQRGMNVVDTIF